MNGTGEYEKATEAYFQNKLDEAVALYEDAAGKGNANAVLQLASLYDPLTRAAPGLLEPPKDESKARYYYQLAFELAATQAEADDPAAQAALGQLYHWGWGVAPDSEKALYWYKRAFANGFYFAANHLFSFHPTPCGNPLANWEEAGYWYRKAKELGVPVAYDSRFE